MCDKREYIRKAVKEQHRREVIINEARDFLRSHDYIGAGVKMNELRMHGGPLRSYEWVDVQETVEGAEKWRF